MKTFSALYFLTLFAPVLSSQEIRLLLEMPGVGKPSYRYESLGGVADVRQLAVPFVGERVLALDRKGHVHEWRRNPVAEFSGDWRVLDAPDGVKKIAAGSRHTLLLLADGKVWAAGGNSEGQLGDGSLADRESFRRVESLPEIDAIAAGSNFSLALDRTGRVWGWGANWSGVVPGDSRKLISWPVAVSGIPAAKNVIVRADSPFAWDGNDLWSWGLLDYPERRIRVGAERRLLSEHLFTSKEHLDVVRSLKLELSSADTRPQLLWWPGLEDGSRTVEIGIQSRGSLSVKGRNAVAGWAVAWSNEPADEAVASLSLESENRSQTGGRAVQIVAPRAIAAGSRTAAFTPRQAVSLSASSVVVGPPAGSGSFSITADQAWTAASSNSWLTVTPPASGTGSAILNYSFTANTGTTGRMATITVAGQTYTVTQAATNGSFTPWGVGAYGVIRTIAGTGPSGSSGGYGGDGGAATSAQLYSPLAVAVDGSGNVYVADVNNNRIRKISATTGIITTIAGTGVPGYSGDGGAAASAQLNGPHGVAVDGSGNVYVADISNNRVRKISPTTGIITTIAGTGTVGYGGDGGAATSAKLSSPTGVGVDGSGNVYIADSSNQRIRKISAATGIITTIAGTGTVGYGGDGGAATSAKLSYPSGVAVDGTGNVYVADYSNHRTRKISATTGIITTIAGTGTVGYSGDGGVATSAQLSNPSSVAVDGSGNVYVAHWTYARIRKINAVTGIITTIAGGSEGFGGDGGSATSGLLWTPFGVAVDGSANVYIADEANNRIRFVDYTTPQVIKPASKVGAFGSGYWVQDLNGNFAWDGLSVDRQAFFSAGQAGEVPISGDWNGDGKDKLGTYINGTWILDYNGNGQWDGAGVDKLVFFGGPGWTPVVGDWNGDGKAKIGVYKDGTWMLDYDGNYAWNPPTDKLLFWGGVGYTPVMGDWNNTGWTKIGVHKQGLWLLDYDGDFAWNAAIDKTVFFGGSGYTPVVGDWNGSGNTKIGATLDGLWVIDYNGNFLWDGLVTDKLVFFGGAGWIPMVGDWDGNGKTKVGAYKDGTWVLDVNGNFTWDTPPDQLIFFGGPGQTPVAGRW